MRVRTSHISRFLTSVDYIFTKHITLYVLGPACDSIFSLVLSNFIITFYYLGRHELLVRYWRRQSLRGQSRLQRDDFPRYCPVFNVPPLMRDSNEGFTVISRICYSHCCENRQFSYLTRGYATLTRSELPRTFTGASIAQPLRDFARRHTRTMADSRRNFFPR